MAGGKGKIYNITPNQGTLNVEEYGSVRGFDYHTVYFEGTYIYDPRYSSTPITESSYFNTLKKLNPMDLITNKENDKYE